MFATLFAVFFAMWLLGLYAFHVTSGMIHMLLVVAVISLMAHIVSGRTAI